MRVCVCVCGVRTSGGRLGRGSGLLHVALVGQAGREGALILPALVVDCNINQTTSVRVCACARGRWRPLAYGCGSGGSTCRPCREGTWVSLHTHTHTHTHNIT